MPQASSINIDYTSTWHPQLNPTCDDSFLNLIRKVKNFLFYFPISLVAACINPRSECWQDMSAYLETPDKVLIGVQIYSPYKKKFNQKKYVIIFNPLGNNHYPWLFKTKFQEELLEKGFHVVVFNYRGWRNTWSPKDLVVDGESVYQYLVNDWKIAPENIHFFGTSLGGWVAAQVKALHPECSGKYIGDRTFRSLFHVITEYGCITRFGSTIKKISSIFSLVIAYPLYWLGLDADIADILPNITGEKKIFYLETDSLICGESRLHLLCNPEETVQLRDGQSHFASIGDVYTKENAKASQVAIDFFAGSTVF